VKCLHAIYPNRAQKPANIIGGNSQILRKTAVIFEITDKLKTMYGKAQVNCHGGKLKYVIL
jgi:hypothetical protein